MQVERVESDRKRYKGTISDSIAAYYIGMEPQPEKVLPLTLKGYIPIVLSPEGHLVSFEFLDLQKTNRNIPQYDSITVLQATPVFSMPSPAEEYEWSCFRHKDAFIVKFRQVKPSIEYRTGDVSFYCIGAQLVAIEARHCEIIK